MACSYFRSAIYAALFSLLFLKTIRCRILFVDNAATCQFTCDGTSSMPYLTLTDALNNVVPTEQNTIIVGKGVYSGGSNTRLSVTAPITIQSLYGSEETIFDCQRKGRAFHITSSAVSIKGLSFINGNVNTLGGALLIEDSNVTLTDVILSNNTADKGAGLYASNSIVNLVSSIVENNTALVGGAFYVQSSSVHILGTVIMCNSNANDQGDIHATASNITVDLASDINSAGVYCDNSSWTFTDGRNVTVCGNSSKCNSKDGFLNNFVPLKNITECGDKKCNLKVENCLTCPSDCSCSFTGVKTQIWDCHPSDISPTCNSMVSTLTRPRINGLLPLALDKPVTGTITGYFNIPKTGYYTFLLQGENIGAQLYLNGKRVIDGFFIQDQLYSTASVILESKYIHYLNITFFTLSNRRQSLELLWKRESLDVVEDFIPFNGTYYNVNVKGDHICDYHEVNQNTTFYESTEKTLCRTVGKETRNDTCGNGVCNDLFPETCFVDCHFMITRQCSPFKTFGNSISSNTPTARDTIGKLIQKQKYWHLPGIEHIATGFDVIKGQEVVAPLFYFSYCDEDELNIVQDVYREAYYILPREIYARPAPKCSYEATSETFKNSVKMANSMEKEMGLDISGNLNINFLEVDIDVSLGFSMETSVKQARELEKQSSGGIAKTEVICQTSQVELKNITFHPKFLEELSVVEEAEDLYPIMEKYGTHYIKSATMGGKLVQLTSFHEDLLDDKIGSEYSRNMELSFGLSASVPVFGSGNIDFEGSLDTKETSETQTHFEEKSSRTSIITYGGPPGSFGPDYTNNAPTNFGDWASYVDLLPVPVQFQLDDISNIIPETWRTRNNTSIKQLWSSAVDDFLQMDRDGEKAYKLSSPGRYKYSLLMHWVEQVSTTVQTQITLWVYSNNSVSKIRVLNQYYEPGFTQTAPLEIPLQSSANRRVSFNFRSNKLLPANSIKVLNDEHLTFGGEAFLIDWTTGDVTAGKSTKLNPNDASNIFYSWTRLTDVHHLIVYNLSLTTGNMPDESGKTKIEWTLYGTSGSKTVQWWRVLGYGGWQPTVPFHFEAPDTQNREIIGDIVGARLQFGSLSRTACNSKFKLTSLSVMSKPCSGCPTKIYTTPPSYTTDITCGPNAPIVKLYPIEEFSRSASFLNGRKV